MFQYHGAEHMSIYAYEAGEPLSVEVDEIYNLACPASPAHYQRDPIQTLKTSVLGTINLL